MGKRILIVGDTGNFCLETSYQQAFIELGWEVIMFDINAAVRRYARPTAWAIQLHRFFPVESWLKKANKELAELALETKPDIFMAFTAAQVLPGTFAFIKSILPTSVVWYWADPLPNLNRFIHSSLPLADLLASYSDRSLGVFTTMGAKKTGWLPFAVDLKAHYAPVVTKEQYKYDLSFIGSWRPEREKALQTIYESFPNIKLKVSGPYWNRCTFSPLKKIAGTAPLYGPQFSAVVQDSLLCLNVMDTNNYPAVNMRFFELMAAGGAQLCSDGLEMKEIFKDREQVLYFTDKDSLIKQLQYALAHPKQIEAMRKSAQDLVIQAHTYRHRAETLLAQLEK